MDWNEEGQIRCQFKFTCPQLWDRLHPTGVDGVRHCPECERDVHLALTEEDFRRHSGEGRCAAVPVLRNDQEAEPDFPIHAVGMAMPPYGAE